MGIFFSFSKENSKKQINLIKQYVGKWGKPIQNDPFKLVEKLDISEDPWIKTNFDKYFSTVI